MAIAVSHYKYTGHDGNSRRSRLSWAESILNEELHEVDDARTEYTDWSEKPNGECGENAQ